MQTRVVQSDHHMFYLTDGEDNFPDPADFPTSTNGLADRFGAALVILTGAAMSETTVDVDVADTEPAADLHLWEEAVEVSLPVESGVLQLLALGYDLEPSPLLMQAPEHAYRVRVHARGRDTDIDGVLNLAEQFLLQIWPAAIAEETTLKRTDRYGEETRAANRRRTDAGRGDP